MIALRKMTEEEFRAFRETSVSEYAPDLMKGRDMSREQALRAAEKEFDEALPDGLGTAGSFLMDIDGAEGNRVGWIFFRYRARENGERPLVFLEDLLIFEPERRKGYASAAIAAMNEMAKKDGCSSSALFVWDHNPGGTRLYERCGYTPRSRGEGGTAMEKEL